MKTIATGPFAGLPKPMGRPWTRTEDDFLRDNWRLTIPELAEMTGRSEGAVYTHCLKLGIPRSSNRRARFEPTFEEWHQAALNEARIAALPLRLILTPCQRPDASVARWRAWRHLKETRSYSLAGIGRATGWHHTSVMHGLERLKDLELRLPSLKLLLHMKTQRLVGVRVKRLHLKRLDEYQMRDVA